jgi:murein DD-endopeptidase MepM/ murein hydrolase activator NlpD
MHNKSTNKITMSRSKPAANERWWYFPFITLSFFALAAFFGAAGFYFGSYQQPSHSVEKFQHALDEQRTVIEGARQEVRADLDAFTQRIGLLQAHVNRINALGTKMITMAGLKEEEFDFSSVPAMGGADESLDQSGGYENEEITRVLEALELALIEKEQQLNILDELILSQYLQEEVQPKGMPVNQGWLSSGYGYRNNPFTGKRQFHRGMDFAGPEGTPIFSAAGGMVTKVNKQKDYGLIVEIDHRNGYITRYAHTLAVLVNEGDIVKKGQPIAKMGNSGRSTGPHLHFEVIQDGKHINPSELLDYTNS